MHLRIIGVCVAVLAWAAVLVTPGLASAAWPPVLYSGETQVPVGTEVMANSVGPVVFTSSSGEAMFQCTSSKMTGNVVANSSGAGGALISVNSGVFKGTGSAERCQVGFENVGIIYDTPMCLRVYPFGNGGWDLYGGSCNASGAVGFTYFGSVAGTCHYSRSELSLNDESPTTEPLQMLTSASAFTRVSGGSLCPTALGIKAEYEMKTTYGANLKTL